MSTLLARINVYLVAIDPYELHCFNNRDARHWSDWWIEESPYADHDQIELKLMFDVFMRWPLENMLDAVWLKFSISCMKPTNAVQSSQLPKWSSVVDLGMLDKVFENLSLSHGRKVTACRPDRTRNRSRSAAEPQSPRTGSHVRTSHDWRSRQWTPRSAPMARRRNDWPAC